MSIPLKPLWKHPFPHSTNVDVFRRIINHKYALNLVSYEDLYQWSVDEVDKFCSEVWTFCGMIHSRPPKVTVTGLQSMWPRPRWFPGARLNYTENIIGVGLSAHPDAIAVSDCREGSTSWRHLTWRQLRVEVEGYTSALRAAGVKNGDRIATCLTNSTETLIILLACGAIGALFTSTSPDMGADGIVERYLQIRPKLLFVTTEILYGGRKIDIRGKMNTVIQKLLDSTNELERVIVVQGRSCTGRYTTQLKSFLNVKKQKLEFEQVEFDYPIYILYSSGTTGPPKCICHAGGAALLQQKKELMLVADLGPSSVYYQYTTTGWMMWNYAVAGLSTGARIILYDGSPLHPSPASQLELLAQQRVTHWGTSPKFLTSLKQQRLTTMPDLENLELTMVSGSPLSAEISEWFYQTFPNRVGLFSGSGGTDLVGGIINGSPLAPVYKGELATACLGMKVEIWNYDGKNIEDSGERGDLVITKPFFSMPLTFWGENGEEKYQKAYFDKFPGVWWHGDFIRKNPATGGYEILGRSDGVLNPGGIRFGTAEIYRVVDKFNDVEDCIAVGQRRENDIDEQVLLFVKLKKGPLSDTLQDQIKKAIRTSLSPRHVPAYILEVADIPYTANGKKVENVVRDVVSGRPPKVGGTVVNPECLDLYKTYTALPQITHRARI